MEPRLARAPPRSPSSNRCSSTAVLAPDAPKQPPRHPGLSPVILHQSDDDAVTTLADLDRPNGGRSDQSLDPGSRAMDRTGDTTEQILAVAAQTSFQEIAQAESSKGDSLFNICLLCY